MIASILIPALLSASPNTQLVELTALPPAAVTESTLNVEASHAVYGPMPAPGASAQGAPLTILETASAAGRFSTLAAALNAADLVGTLSGPGPFTVFAPTNSAFRNVPPGRLAFLLQPENKALLQEVLTFHVVSGNVDSTQVLASPFLDTVAEQRAEIDAGNVQIEGANLIATDIVCSNGIIHVVDSVLLPELRTISQLANANDDFDQLYDALVIAGLDDDLDGAGPFTVFAPTDDAFRALPSGLIESLTAADLGNILGFHVTTGRNYVEDVLAAGGFSMLNGGQTTITTTSEGAFIDGAEILVTDIETRNGVIHVIDAVLIPGS